MSSCKAVLPSGKDTKPRDAAPYEIQASLHIFCVCWYFSVFLFHVGPCSLQRQCTKPRDPCPPCQAAKEMGEQLEQILKLVDGDADGRITVDEARGAVPIHGPILSYLPTYPPIYLPIYPSIKLSILAI